MGLTDKAGLAFLNRMIKAGQGTQVAQGIIHGAVKEGRKYTIKQGRPNRGEFEVFCGSEIDGDKVFQDVMQQVGLKKKTVVDAMMAGYDEVMKQGDTKRIPKRQPCPKCGKWVKHKAGVYSCNKCHHNFELPGE